MVIELVNTGSELMLGRVLNTHQQWICRQLADRGWIVTRQVAIADTGPSIQASVREGLSRSDLVITTGGLGPTSDDITRELVAELLGTRLVEDTAVLERIAAFFKSRGRPMPQRTRREAQVPEGAMVLPNEFGTAPGLAMKVTPNPFQPGNKTAWLIMLPGPPRELRPMFLSLVLPLLQREMPPVPFVCRTLRVTGVGESVVEEKVDGPLQPCIAAGLELGYCARPSQVDVRLAARGSQAAALVEQAEAIVRRALGNNIYGSDEEDVAGVVVALMTARKKTLAIAESCTGGFIAHRITNVSGASAVLLSGVVTYSNASKTRFLGVRTETLASHGAVSESVAREMADGARRESGADYAISVTGIAGPTGGTPEKPVGTVFIGLSGPSGSNVIQRHNPWDRETFKFVTSQQALEWLRRTVLEGE